MKRALTDSTGDLFLSVARRLRRELVSALKAHDITPTQSRALRIVCNASDAEGGPRLSHIAEKLRVAPRTATELVDALEEHGLVERCSDPSDRRATCVRPTDEGTRLRAVIEDARRRESARFLERLPAADRRELHRILTTLDERDDH